MNSSNNKWLIETPLSKNRNQGFYIETPLPKNRDQGFYIEAPLPKDIDRGFYYDLGKGKNWGNDDFLEGFYDPFGEQERKERLEKIRVKPDNQSWSSQGMLSSQTDPFLEGFNGISTEENKMTPDLFKKTTGILSPQLPFDTNQSLNELQNAFRGSQFDGALIPTVQKINSSPSITPAINRNLNAKNEFEHAIGDPNKEPVMVQYASQPSPDKKGRSNKNNWSLKNDEQGISILSHWLLGGGKDYIHEDGIWGKYMKSNEALTLQVKKIVLPLADDLSLNDSKEVDITMPMVIDTGESIIGYQYLHGTDATVGGFQIKGTVYKDEKGDVTYDLTYTWNDIINPNYSYPTDAEKVEFAKSLPFVNPKDYIIRISWHDKTKIKANPGLFNRNSGWLK